MTNSLVLKSRELTNSLVLKSRELEILVFHFSLYYNVSGGGMARRYWKIPSSSLGEKNLNSPLAASPLVGNSFFLPWDSEGIFQYLLAIPPPFLQFYRFLERMMIFTYCDILSTYQFFMKKVLYNRFLKTYIIILRLH